MKEWNYVSIGNRILSKAEEAAQQAKQERLGIAKTKNHAAAAEGNSKFVPVWKQEVRDEKGRKRLHGAFTGGFSAGYYNTVGSKEGWAPSTFVSSRKDKQSTAGGRRQAKPEDFMDEEDWQSFTGGDKKLKVIPNEEQEEEMENEGFGRKSSLFEQGQLNSLNKVGRMLLERVGFESSAASSSSDDMDYGFGALQSLLKKSRVAQALEERKEKLVSSRSSAAVNQVQGKKGQRAATGFGVGILEDEDEDDEDIYRGTTTGISEFKSKSRLKSIVSRQAAREESFEEIGGDPVAATEEEELAFTKPVYYNGSKFDWKIYRDRARNNGGVLPGFVASSGNSSDRMINQVDPSWSKVDIPKDWKPPVYLGSDSTKSGGAVRDARDRARILGEEELPGNRIGPKPSIEATDPEPEVEDKFKGIPLPPWLNFYPKLKVYLYRLEPGMALSAMQGFQPFQKSDESKQFRYLLFLKSCLDISVLKELIFPPNYGEIEIAHELEEFIMAARVYQPLGNSMASRFVRATEKTDQTLKQKNGGDPEVEAEALTPETPSFIPRTEDAKQALERQAVLAKRMGLGLTRSVGDWGPAPLLCKRFGFDDPYPDRVVGHSEYSSLGSYSNRTDSLPNHGGNNVAPLLAPEKVLHILSDLKRDQRAKNFQSSVLSSGGQPSILSDDDEDEEDSGPRQHDDHPPVELATEDLPPPRPAMALFQSIFGE